MFGGMTVAYATYQMSGLTTGCPMGFLLASPFGFSLGPSAGTLLLGTLSQTRFTADEWLILHGMTANQLATGATQPAVPSIGPGHPAVQPSRLSGQLLPCISGYQQPRRYGSTGCEDQLGVDRPAAQALRPPSPWQSTASPL
ncbi:hypothetical protein RvY_03369 [Ramazzottius varieornatus]|uniref:Uncharacterized protein n=1 Tax=Ramazzottius varieornatus TaxID=947166 RepID=A0A1D1UMT1_RAMVA|nr:hypothetical protein RvY_03369 [Ramazzottius varieornatus]